MTRPTPEPPQLVFHEWASPSGYAPRVIQLSASPRNVLFVGCKDGSVMVVEGPEPPHGSSGASKADTQAQQWRPRSLVGPDASSAAVRSICEWDDARILVGRNDGSLELIDWGDGRGQPVPVKRGDGDSVLTVARLDGKRAVLSCRSGGCRIVERVHSEPVPSATLKFAEPTESGWKELSSEAIRFVAPLARRLADGHTVERWLFISERGELFSWGGGVDDFVVPAAPDLWKAGERPAAVNDIGLWRRDDARRKYEPARGVFIATDTGVYLLDLDDRAGRQDHERLQICRLSLSGLGSICTALSYTESDQVRYLWAADLSGDCHLFWDHNPGDDGYLDFRRSGLVHADSQVLVCFAWYGRTTGARGNPSTTLFFGQARRNDRIVVSDYTPIASGLPDELEGAHPTRIRRLLSHGSVEEIMRFLAQRRLGSPLGHGHDSISHESTDTELEGWGDEKPAILAELFEHLSAGAGAGRIVLESLLGQSAADGILSEHVETIARRQEVDACRKVAEEVNRLLQTWALALLGVIHRHPIPRERDAAYLSLLRWVRNRQQRLRRVLEGLDWSTQQIGEVEKEVEVSLRFVRKWGVYGEANAWRKDVVLPLLRLAGSSPSAAERLDRLTYQILLYDRQVSLRGPGEERPMRGRTAWSMAHVELGPGLQVVVVSWTWGGIEVFRVRRDAAATGPEVDLRWEVRSNRAPSSAEVRPIPLKTLSDLAARTEIQRDTHGHSRAVHVGRVGSAAYLLVAPAGGPDDPGREHVYLGAIAETPGRDVDVHPLVGVPLPDSLESESIHSLAEIEPGWLVVGLRGSRRTPRLGLLKIQGGSASLDLEWRGSVRLDAPAAGGKSEAGERFESRDGSASERTGGASAEEAETNRAWSLAVGRAEEPATGGRRATVFVGCERGEVLRVEIESPGEGWGFAKNEAGEAEREQVASLSSSVRALAYREVSGGSRRLFAGGEDGTIMAWQEVEQVSAAGPGRRFVSLWATAEQGAITDLHLLPEVELVAEEGSERHRAVLAVTRNGRAVLFDDREEAGEPEEGRTSPGRSFPTRIPFPGCRHGRPDLGMSCFASVVTQSGAPIEETSARTGAGAGVGSGGSRTAGEDRAPFVPKVELLVASGEGTVRLVGIHDPAHSDSRDDRYRWLLEDWWRLLEGAQQLRLGSALYRAAPAMERILVRWLIDPTYPCEISNRKRERDVNKDVYQPRWTAALSPEETWGLPRHLRPLLDVRTAWERLGAATGDATEEAREIGQAFELLLKRAWQYDDLRLFQEVCEVVLKRANFLLHDRIVSRTDGKTVRWQTEKRNLMALYEALFGALERTVQRWLGAGEDKEARAHMAIVKHLVDGDTVRQLLGEVEREGLAAPDASAARPSPADAPGTAILHRRIGGVSDLVFKRNPLVNLEAIRAANLSLFRMCKRLSSEPQEGWPGRAEVQWRVFAPYFDHLVAAAGRTFGSSIELGDALAHEYGRTFALAICACPSATIRIANRLTETLLITDPDSEEDFSHRVSWQLRLLEELGLQLPEAVPLLFGAVARPRRGLINPMDQVRKDLGIPGWEEPEAGRTVSADPPRRWPFGEPNEYDLTCMELLYDGVVGWFVQLQETLATDAQWIDLTLKTIDGERKLPDLAARCAELKTADSQNLYRHSRSFWEDQAQALETALDGHVRAVSRGIRPEIVVVSRRLGAWAFDALERLDQRYRTARIFQPEYRHFREVLLRFERVAKTFRASAAVHKSIVEGVLGHHLLEDLDEHVLELVEIAHVMDPWMVQTYLGGGRATDLLERNPSTAAEGFAAYLLGRSRNAESIPKNLRMLQSLLLSRKEYADDPSIQQVIHRGLGEDPEAPDGEDPETTNGAAPRWRVPKRPAYKVAGADARFLELVVRELDQNDVAYGPEDAESSDGSRATVTFPRVMDEDVVFGVAIRFHIRRKLRLARGENALERLEELCRAGLQEPFRPWPHRSYASHGTGLYLANLAAAVVGWRLRIGRKDSWARARTVTFHLEKLRAARSTGAGG